MAAGNLISVTTTKHTYVLYDSVDNTPSIDNKGLTPRYQLKLDGTVVTPGMVRAPGSAAGYIRFTSALKAFWQFVRYYERR